MRGVQDGNPSEKFGSEDTPVLGRSFRRPCDLFVVSPPVTSPGLAPPRPHGHRKSPAPAIGAGLHTSLPPDGQKQGRGRKTLGGISVWTTNLQAVFPEEVIEVVSPVLGLGQRLLQLALRPRVPELLRLLNRVPQNG